MRTRFLARKSWDTRKWKKGTEGGVIPKLRLKNTIIHKTLTYAPETWTLTKRDRKQLNIFERKAYKRNLSPPPQKKKKNWRILTNKEINYTLK
jgi:hypothetical protein